MKRYKLFHEILIPDDAGVWVKYEDVEQLEDENKRLRETLFVRCGNGKDDCHDEDCNFYKTLCKAHEYKGEE